MIPPRTVVVTFRSAATNPLTPPSAEAVAPICTLTPRTLVLQSLERLQSFSFSPT